MNHEIKLFCEADNQSQIRGVGYYFIRIYFVPVLSTRTENDMTDATAGHRKKYWRMVFFFLFFFFGGVRWSPVFRWMSTLLLLLFVVIYWRYLYIYCIAVAPESISGILSDSKHDKKILMKLIILLHVELTVNLICPRRLGKKERNLRVWVRPRAVRQGIDRKCIWATMNTVRLMRKVNYAKIHSLRCNRDKD